MAVSASPWHLSITHYTKSTVFIYSTAVAPLQLESGRPLVSGQVIFTPDTDRLFPHDVLPSWYDPAD